MRKVRAFAPAIVMTVGVIAMALAARQREVPLAASLASIPIELDGHRGIERTISDEEQRVARVTDYLFRTYARDSLPGFTVYVGYYPMQMQGSTIHSPKNCLPGSGWHALGSSIETIESVEGRVPVNRYELRNGQARAIVFYWYQGRGRVAANEYLVKWHLLRDAVLRGRSEEALVRIVVPVIDQPGEEPAVATARADARGRSAAAVLIPEVQRVLPSLTGPTGNTRVATLPDR